MSTGPLPTKLILLSNLPSVPNSSKVRFLGCVTHYNLSTGIISLEHAHSTFTTTAVRNSAVALVDVNLLLESLKREDTQVGAWVNVVGSTEGVANEAPGEGKVRKGSTTNGEGELGNRTVRVRVKAVMLWSAGAVRLGEYEEIVHARKELGKH